MRRAAAIALAALSAVPAPAGAQFRARPMVIPVAPTPAVDLSAVLAGALSTPSDPADPGLADLLHARSGAAASLRPHHDLLAPLAASPVAQPAIRFTCAAAGRLAENGSDARGDVVYCAGALNQIQIAFGDAPGTLRSYFHALNTNGGATPTLASARLLPRAADVVVLPVSTGRGLPNEGDLYALDFGPAAGAPPMTDRRWDARSITTRLVPDEVLTLRISPSARSLGVDDLYVPGAGSVTLFAHSDYAAAPATLADVTFGNVPAPGGAVRVGWAPGPAPAWFPAGAATEVLGAAALDVDGDGDLDLVLSLSPSHPVAGSPPGRLFWVERTSDVASLATSTPWHELTGHVDLQPLVDPAVLRALEIGGEPAVAVFDRGSDAVLVFAKGDVPGRLRVFRGGAAGRSVHDLRLADLVGSPAPELVADATQADEPEPAILVWPDLGDASPELAWPAAGAGAGSRGEDLPLSVLARDPDGPFTVDWMLDDPYGAPASSSTVAGGVSTEVGWTVDGALLCKAPPEPLPVTVRATDALGVFDEVAATVPVASAPPALALAASEPPGRLALPPGGTTATLDGSAWTRCGPVAFFWGGSAFAAAAGSVADDGPTTTRRTLDFPEASYPALLAGDPDATLLAIDLATLFASPRATLALDLDARGLVEVDHAAEVVALSPGEATVIRTRLRNRLAVPLPQVHVVDVLSGLAVAGEPRVLGAGVLATSSGGAEIVLDALPPSGAEVIVELPVRSLGDRGASAVEARSSGGHLLTPAASAAAGDPSVPGCGCGGGGAGAEALLLLAAAFAIRGRRRARPT